MNLLSRTRQIVLKFLAFPWLPEVLAGIALLSYFAQSVSFAHSQWSVLDEGNYIYKGWLFASGQYIQYQAYGPLTNHMPLSYLIFGWVQLIFGPGLRTVRYFMVAVGCIFMLGMWLTTRRLAGRWAAAASLWFIALNPFPISDYSIAISEGIVACLLTWILFFILGENRSPRQLLLGSLLTGIVILIRENMILVLPVIVLYMLWQHGKKASLIFTIVVAAFFVSAHIIFWPGIMEVWDRWIPNNIRPLFNGLVFQDYATPLNAPLEQKVFILFSSVKTNFMAIFSVLVVWLSWPKKGFKNPAQFKMIVFLSAIFVGLYIAHAVASLGKNYCAFCLVNYVTFFSPAAILMFFAFLPGVKERQPLFPAWLAGALIVMLLAGVGYSNYENFGQSLALINVPRVGGSVELWKLLTNKFGLDFQTQRRLLPIAAGALIGAGSIIVGFFISRANKIRAIHALLGTTLILGLILSPTNLLGSVGGVCNKDIIRGYETVGAELAQRIKPGSQIYWRGDASPAPLLYLKNIKIYPPQLNAFFSFKSRSDSDRALRYGFWNSKLDFQWRAEADVILIRESEYAAMQRQLSSPGYIELQPTSPTYACTDDSGIRIFERK